MTLITSSLFWHISVILFLQVVKCLTIYRHLDQFIQFDERKAVVLLRIVIWSLSLLISHLDIGLHKDLTRFAAYSVLRQGNMLYNGSITHTYGHVAPYTSCFMVIFGLMLHLKIEAENKKMSKNEESHEGD